MPKNFAVIGVGGYIAPRHLQAIRDTSNRLVAALDPNDSVGILDQFSDDAAFFTDVPSFERFARERFATDSRIDWVSVCTPNDLHESHVQLAFRLGANAICEKPLTLTPESLNAIAAAEKATGRRVFTILQLRHHPKLLALRDKLARAPSERRHDVELTYITPRGPWYHASWKGDAKRSGGLVTNIGIHLFDLLLWLFGRPTDVKVDVNEPNRVSGSLSLERADVRWYLSIDGRDLPQALRAAGRRTFRELAVDGSPVEFTDGFTDLHTKVYRSILDGHGFGVDDVRSSIEIVESIRSVRPTPGDTPSHPIAIRHNAFHSNAS